MGVTKALREQGTTSIRSKTGAGLDNFEHADSPFLATRLPPQRDQLTTPSPSTPRREFSNLEEAIVAARYGFEKLDPGKENRFTDYFADNPAHLFRLWFGNRGLEIEARPSIRSADTWNLRLKTVDLSWGSETRTPTGDSVISTSGKRLNIAHAKGRLIEWFENGPNGLEQGYTIRSAPGRSDGNPLRVTLNTEGDLHPRLSPSSPGDIDLIDKAGRPVLRYKDLKTFDATGKVLQSWLDVSGRFITLVVNDAQAAYPITIDPLIINIATSMGPDRTGDGSAEDYFGASVAIDGDYAVIGAPQNENGYSTGTAYIFKRSENLWALEQELEPEISSPQDRHVFGSSVAISGDTIIVGDPLPFYSSTGRTYGMAHVYVRNGSTWTVQQTLQPTEIVQGDSFGFGRSVALDGDTIVVGDPRYSSTESHQGKAHIFTRGDGTWTLRASFLATSPIYDAQFGCSVDVCGTTVIVASQKDADNGGAAYVYISSQENWSLQQILRSPSGTSSWTLRSVAVDGDTAILLYPTKNSALVFTRTSGTWDAPSLLPAPDFPSTDLSFAPGLALDSGTVVIGVHCYDQIHSQLSFDAITFYRTAGVWAYGNRIQLGGRRILSPLELSAAVDGGTILLGDPARLTEAGAAAGEAYIYTGAGATWTVQTAVNAGDGGYEVFGTSVDLEDNTAVVGSPLDSSSTAKQCGSVYVFTRSGDWWSQQAKLRPGDSSDYDDVQLGISIAIYSDTLIAGSARADSPNYYMGGAYIYTRNGNAWTLQEKLMNSGDFGVAVDIDANHAVIGSPSKDSGGVSFAGAAYVYLRSGSGWNQQSALYADTPEFGAEFGQSVAISGDSILIGAWSADLNGKAYLFTRSGSTWNQETVFTPNGEGYYGRFGWEVALEGTVAAVGAPGENYKGAVYVYRKVGGTWTNEAHLLPPAELGTSSDFGRAVALQADILLVGCPDFRDYDIGGFSHGAVCLYRQSSSAWSLQDNEPFLVNDRQDGDSLGNDVALSGSTALLAAKGRGSGGRFDPGSVYIVDIVAQPRPDISVKSPTGAVLVDDLATNIILASAYYPLGGQSQNVFTIRNLGDDILSGITISLAAESAAEFSVGPPGQPSISPGEVTTFMVTFSPISGSTKNGHITIYSNDPGEHPFDILISAAGSSSQAAWRQYYFTSGSNEGISGDSADPDGDGQVNFLEYALGSSPVSGSSRGTPIVTYVKIGSSTYLQISVNKPPGAASLTYSAHVSSNLTTWQTGSPYVSVVVNNSSSFAARDRTPVGNVSRYIRLQVGGSP